jgi:hypothetical protein
MNQADIASSASFEPQETLLKDPDFWVQEAIYGHRFIPEQEPYMMLLEMLSVCRGRIRLNEKAFPCQVDHDLHENFQYQVPLQRKLRFLLFQESKGISIRQDQRIPFQEKLPAFKRALNAQYRAHSDEDHFKYLDCSFGEFDDLHCAIELVRSLEIDVVNSRRMTSRFLAPRGPNLMLHDFDEKGWNEGGGSTDRRFFGRGGEIVWLMLNRSASCSALNEAIIARFFANHDKLDRLAGALSDPADTDSRSPSIGYLPIKRHIAYDRLGEDFLNILACRKLPDSHLFGPLSRIIGLNLLRYFAERAHDLLKQKRPDPFVVDMTAGGDQELREVSLTYYRRHRHASHHAVDAFIDRTVEADAEWRSAAQSSRPDDAARALNRLFHRSEKSGDKFEVKASPDRQIAAMKELAKQRSKNDIYKIIPVIGTHSGFVTARRRAGTWFGPSDEMLEAIVMANVSRPTEIREFLQVLYNRYGMVIGPMEARDAFARIPCDGRRFEENVHVLEARLNGLGLLKRLSDDCGFLINPYRN